MDSRRCDRPKSATWFLPACLILAATTAAAQPAPTTRPTLSKAELEKKFEKTMSNAVMSGSFTMNGSDRPPGHDKYTLGSVTRKEGAADIWIFTTNIQYGGHNVSLPLEIPVKWADDTPVISVTNFGVPGLGTYTARVVIYGDQYAGIWGSSDGSHGGQMWGKIEHPTTQPAK
jgi:hypothetical protein